MWSLSQTRNSRLVTTEKTINHINRTTDQLSNQSPIGWAVVTILLSSKCLIFLWKSVWSQSAKTSCWSGRLSMKKASDHDGVLFKGQPHCSLINQSLAVLGYWLHTTHVNWLSIHVSRQLLSMKGQRGFSEGVGRFTVIFLRQTPLIQERYIFFFRLAKKQCLTHLKWCLVEVDQMMFNKC